MAANFLTSDDIKRRLFCEQEGTYREMITVKSGLGSSDTTVLRKFQPEYVETIFVNNYKM